jgi:serine/threonine protein kinase
VKIFDFGLAKELRTNERLEDGTYKLTGDTGSPRYMAPEVANCKDYNGKKLARAWAYPVEPSFITGPFYPLTHLALRRSL